MRILRRTPIHVLLFALYPSLALLSENMREVETSVVLRPALGSVLLVLVAFAALRLALGDTGRAALATTLLSILFFSYGHAYQLLEATPLLGLTLGRHRYLVPLYLAASAAGLWWIIRRGKSSGGITVGVNVAGLALLAIPIVQIAQFEVRLARGEQAALEVASSGQPLAADPDTPLPDIYYLVLDTYSRSDSMQTELDFDNTPFLRELSQMGFVVAECSRSNYASTNQSLVTSLNLAYLPDVQEMLVAGGVDRNDEWVLIKHSVVRDSLAALGYKTVAFDTTFEWTRLTDADYYIGPGRDRLDVQSLGRFEVLFVKSTALLLVTDARQRNAAPSAEVETHPYRTHIQTQRLILDELPKVAALPEPTFTFAHILIPHTPYVFDAQGGIRTDPGFYEGRLGGPINGEYSREGYVGEVEFLNNRLTGILATILADSSTPPIIVIQGDHGFWGTGDESRRLAAKMSILNAYYLPEGRGSLIYPTITPVNSFRLIFDAYFRTSYGLLEDQTYLDPEADPIPETAPACAPGMDGTASP